MAENEPALPEESLFLQAIEIDSPDERAAFLDRKCAANAELRRGVEALLRHHREGSSFLEAPPTEVVVAAAQLTTSEPDTAALDFLSPSNDPLSLGRLGYYEVLEVLGHGGFGVVLKARDTKLDRIVAVKTLALSLASSATARKRFVREAKAAAAVKHENVVGIYHVADDGPVPYLVMECVSGVSLEAKLQQVGTLDLPAILRIGMQIASGLAAAHKQGLVHRDVKPGNILLENGVERVKITDFGLARAADDAAITKTGEVAGTPQYMSPEQAQGLPLDARSDLFSLGSVLYAMATGRSPFRAESTVAALRRVCDDTPRPIREINSDIPDWLEEIISRLLAKQPSERFQSATEVAELLGQHLAHLQHPTIPIVTNRSLGHSKIQNRGTRDSGSSKSGARRWAIAAAALILLLFGISLAEATGVTHLGATVVRIFTPSGSLVVEAADPAVKVTVEGDGGLTITGAGLEEIRLRPGSYKVHADKDGRPVPLEKELVSIARGGREVVKMRLEAMAPEAAAKADSRSFVVLDGNGVAERKFDMLAEAVQGASDGDTIEIRGNGPFSIQRIKLTSRLTIRAGEGFHPVIQLKDTEMQRAPFNLDNLGARTPLVLEGLEFHGDEDPKVADKVALNLVQAPVYIANCRFVRCELLVQHSPFCWVRNCQFFTSSLPAMVVFGAQRMQIDNNLLTTSNRLQLLVFSGPKGSQRIEVTRNFFLGGTAAICIVSSGAKREPARAPTQLYASRNILAGPASMLRFHASYPPQDAPPNMPAAELEGWLRQTIAWEEEENVYPTGVSPLVLQHEPSATSVEPSQPMKSLADWNQFWDQKEKGSIQGAIHVAAGDAALGSPRKFQPSDFRLRADSAGYRAAADGKDLGADLDTVGPGEAYQHWKKTADYQQWLKVTWQRK